MLCEDDCLTIDASGCFLFADHSSRIPLHGFPQTGFKHAGELMRRSYTEKEEFEPALEAAMS